jgi:hypothetical protein
VTPAHYASPRYSDLNAASVPAGHLGAPRGAATRLGRRTVCVYNACMAMHDSFLAMILTNAKREEASSLTLIVDRDQPRIDMILPDGSLRPISPPPAPIMIKIIEGLEQGARTFESNVFLVTIETVHVQRGIDNVVAQVASWSIEHR